YDLTWDCPGQSTGLNLGMMNNTIGGTVRVTNSNGNAFRFTAANAQPVSGKKIITIFGDVRVDSSVGYLTATGSGSPNDTFSVVVKGDIISKGAFQLANGSGGLVNWYVAGDVQSLGGTFTTNSTATKPDSLIFNGTGTQLLVKNGSVSTMSNIHFLVADGSILDVDTNNIGNSSGTTFTAADNATLISGHANGINGNLTNAGTITLSEKANYVFDGAAAQVTGTKLPAIVNNITINNASGVLLSQLTTINGVLALKAGVFNNLIPFTLGAGGTISFEGGSLLLPLSLNVVSLTEARKDVDNNLQPDHLNDTVKVYGIITTPNYGTTYTSYFIQDAAAGINVYKGGTKMDFAIGDSVFVIGKILQSRGLTEISPLAADSIHFGILKHGAVVPQPKKLSLHEFATNVEQYEGQLVAVDTLYKAKGTWPAAGSFGSVYLTRSNSADTIQLYIDSDTQLDEWTEPLYPINVVGVVSQYSSGSSVYNDGYEIIPRDTNDVVHINVLGVAENGAAIPIEYKLYQNYPNPFNPSTTINFTVAKQGMANVKIYNTLGQEIATLFNQSVEPGKMYSVQFNAGRLSSGMYFSVFESEGHREIKKMLLMK
ncbi:MAG: T9SS type A sorting domain-containing protein, partial [Bacteroidota bacterium]